MQTIKPLQATTKTGEKISIKPYISSRDIKILSSEPYTQGTTSGRKMSVEVTRIDPHSQPALDIRAVTTGKIERTKTEVGYQVILEYEIKFFRPANSTEPIASTHETGTLECEEAITPSPAASAFVWDRFKIRVGASQPSSFTGIMLRDRSIELSVQRLIESHWEEGDDPINGFATYITHSILNSEGYDMMRADPGTVFED